MNHQYYSYNVRAVNNGFTVEANYKTDSKDKDEMFSRYQSDTYIFTKWEEVVDFLKMTEPNPEIN